MPIPRVKLGGTFERVGKPAKVFAYRRRAGWQRPLRGVPVEVAAAGHGSLASEVERGKRIELLAVGQACDHPVLLLHRGV